MDCIAVQSELAAYVSGDLPAEREALIRAHLEICPACRHRCEQYREVDIVLRDWQPLSLSQGFASKVRERLPQRSKEVLIIDFDDEKPRFRQSWWTRATMAVAAAGFVALLIWLTYPKSPSSPPQNMDRFIVKVSMPVIEQIEEYVANSESRQTAVMSMFGVFSEDPQDFKEMTPKEIAPMAARALGPLFTAMSAVP